LLCVLELLVQHAHLVGELHVFGEDKDVSVKLPDDLVIEMKIEPKTKADQDKMAIALEAMAHDDPTFRVVVDPESGETILNGIDELHLDIKIEILKRTYSVDVNVGAPKIAYREHLARATDIDYTHHKKVGGITQFARVNLRLEPNEPGKGNQFDAPPVGSTIPAEYILAVERSVNSVWTAGVLIGFPLIDMKVTLLEVAFDEVDSSMLTFEIATRAAMKEACKTAGIAILEPIMDLEVQTPRDFARVVCSDIDSRRGQIKAQEKCDDITAILAQVPIGSMFGYSSQLRSITSGQATYVMRYSHHAEIPQYVTDGPENFPPAIGMRA
jgi:elongation factor G